MLSKYDNGKEITSSLLMFIKRARDIKDTDTEVGVEINNLFFEAPTQSFRSLEQKAYISFSVKSCIFFIQASIFRLCLRVTRYNQCRIDHT